MKLFWFPFLLAILFQTQMMFIHTMTKHYCSTVMDSIECLRLATQIRAFSEASFFLYNYIEPYVLDGILLVIVMIPSMFNYTFMVSNMQYYMGFSLIVIGIVYNTCVSHSIALTMLLHSYAFIFMLMRRKSKTI